MSLTAITVAFALVAVLFNLADVLSAHWIPRSALSGARDQERRGDLRRLLRATWPAATAEALVLTLFACLWFGSLGSGGWLLVFLLVGTLVAGPDRWLRRRLQGTANGGELRLFAVGLLKYLLAGLVCAWRLS